MLAGAVVSDGVGADELFPDLDGVADDGDLDLASTVFHADVVVLGGEAHVPGRINFPCDRHHACGGPLDRGLLRFRDTRRVAPAGIAPAGISPAGSAVTGAGRGEPAVMVRSSKRRIGGTFPID